MQAYGDRKLCRKRQIRSVTRFASDWHADRSAHLALHRHVAVLALNTAMQGPVFLKYVVSICLLGAPNPKPVAQKSAGTIVKCH